MPWATLRETLVLAWVPEFRTPIDHYREHEESLGWPEHVGVHMTTLSIDDWNNAMQNAGFKDIQIVQVAAKEGFPGTLVMMGRAAHQ